MAAAATGFSRRQVLLVGGGAAAALWAGRRVVFAAGRDETATTGPAGVAARTESLRPLPFADGFANGALPEWNVRRPVAILGTTPFGLPLPANQTLDRPDVLRGRGMVVGLDGPLGSSSGPGLIETVDAFAFEPGTYTLRLRLAGSHQSSDRMPPSTVTASLPGLGISRQVTRRPHDDFLDFTLDVPVPDAARSTIMIASQNAPGQAGLLLDSVSLSRSGAQ